MIRLPSRVVSRVATTLCYVVGFAAAGCSGDKQRQVQRPPIAVLAVPVRRASVPYTIEANGIVTPLQAAAVAPQVDGIITDVDFQEGQDVAKGQVLFHIEAQPYQAAYELAQATLARDKATAENAQLQVKRYAELAESGDVTREQMEQIRATAASAEATVQADLAAIKTAKFNLDNTTIRAPIAGRTGALLVRAGNLVRAGTGAPLVMINQIKPIMVRFAVPSSELGNILKYGSQGGLPVTVSTGGSAAASGASGDSSVRQQQLGGAGRTGSRPDSTGPANRGSAATARTDDPIRGTLSFIDNAVDTTTGTVQLKATFDNRAGTLWVGQFVAVSLRLYVEDNALVVPAQAVVAGQQGTYVYVIDSAKTAEQRPVVVERTAYGLAVLTSGVEDGEQIVTDGQSRLVSGAKVDLRSHGDSTGAGGAQAARTRRGGGRRGSSK